MSLNKSPGLTAKFYTLYWDTIGSTVSTIIKDFFRTGNLGNNFNQALIVVILKKENSTQMIYKVN